MTQAQVRNIIEALVRSGDFSSGANILFGVDPILELPGIDPDGVLSWKVDVLSLGFVYGDLGTSPLYVFNNTFPNGILEREDVVGANISVGRGLHPIPLHLHGPCPRMLADDIHINITINASPS